MTPRTRRPGGVTIVGILVVVMGLAMLVNGGLGLARGGEGPAGIVVAVILLAVGMVYLLVAWGIFRGSRAAHLVVVVLSVIALVGSLIEVLTEEQERALSAATAVIATVVLVLLFTPRARSFFKTTASVS